MPLKGVTLLIVMIAVSMAAVYTYSPEDFQFDLDHLDDAERDRLFEFIDQNNNQRLCKSEIQLLFRQLFRSTEDNSLSDSDEVLLFEALSISEKGLDRHEFYHLWNDWIRVVLKPKSALIVVDVQNDFIDNVTYNGHLYVNQSEQIVPIINNLIETVPFDLVVYTQDWHPSNHCSFIESIKDESIKREIISPKKPRDQYKVGDIVTFANQPVPQKLWPSHGVANTYGAQLYNGSDPLVIANNSIRVHKGTDPEVDSYSAFLNNDKKSPTPLHDELSKRGITDIYLSGVVYEFCVGYTAIDGLSLGYRAAFIENACHQITDDDRDQMREELKSKGASIVNANEVSNMVKGTDRKVQMALVLANNLYNKIDSLN